MASPGKDGGGFSERAGAGSGVVRGAWGSVLEDRGGWRAGTPRRRSEVAG